MYIVIIIIKYIYIAQDRTVLQCAEWTVKPRLHQGNMLPGGRATCCRQQATCCPATCCLLPATRIPLYPATDGQQADNNFVAVNMLLVATI